MHIVQYEDNEIRAQFFKSIHSILKPSSSWLLYLNIILEPHPL